MAAFQSLLGLTRVMALPPASCCKARSQADNSILKLWWIMLQKKSVAPIAIVGMAFRFPGDLSDEHSFWQALKEGRDAVGRIGHERWAVDEMEHPKRSEPGRSITFSAGVLSRIEEFDADFFGICPREAEWLDPQNACCSNSPGRQWKTAGRRRPVWREPM